MERFRLVFSGSGGQGVITASIILAEAAVLHDNLNAIQSQVYGPAARGGAARSDVLISDKPIDFPKVTHPNVLVCLTQEAYHLYHPIIRPGSLLISDSRYVTLDSNVDARQVSLPLYRSVMEQIKNATVYNICVLGALIRLTDIVRTDSVKKVLEQRIPPTFLDMNREALDLGISIASALTSI